LIAVDTNVLVYTHRAESEHHAKALARLTGLTEGDIPWGLPVFCLGEFVRVVTHARVFAPPSTLEQALAALDGFLASPSVRVLMPGPRFARIFADCMRGGDARGNLAFDAQIAAVCLEHGAREMLTLDRDFARFPQLSILPL
jgi:toxin-antitoxin system PIN domain toxin